MDDRFFHVHYTFKGAELFTASQTFRPQVGDYVQHDGEQRYRVQRITLQYLKPRHGRYTSMDLDIICELKKG